MGGMEKEREENRMRKTELNSEMKQDEGWRENEKRTKRSNEEKGGTDERVEDRKRP